MKFKLMIFGAFGGAGIFLMLLSAIAFLNVHELTIEMVATFGFFGALIGTFLGPFIFEKIINRKKIQ